MNGEMLNLSESVKEKEEGKKEEKEEEEKEVKAIVV